MVRDMPQGIKDVVITFENPIIISTRRDVNTQTLLDLAKPESAIRDEYPEGAYGYSQLKPIVMKFERPLRLRSFFLKKHRDSQYWANETMGLAPVIGYYDGKVVLNATIMAHSLIWKNYEV